MKSTVQPQGMSVSALEGSVLEANRSRSANHVHAVVGSHSKPDTAAECWLD